MNKENNQGLQEIHESIVNHFEFTGEQRNAYYTRIELARQHSSKFLLITISADETNWFGLPHFSWDLSGVYGNFHQPNNDPMVAECKIIVDFFALKEYGLKEHCSVFLVTKEYERGGNHYVEAIHRVLSRIRAEQGKLPEVSFLGADNQIRMERNHQIMAYLQSLVGLGEFREVQVSFLPEGHEMHETNKAHKFVKRTLESNSAVTMRDVLEVLRFGSNANTSYEEIAKVANFSGLCDKFNCLHKKDELFSKRYYRFMPKIGDDAVESIHSTSTHPPRCFVKDKLQVNWTFLENPYAGNGFLKFVPDFRKIPATLTLPPGDFAEVSRYIERYNIFLNEDEKKSVRALRDKVYRHRIEALHWDLDKTFELHGPQNSSLIRKHDWRIDIL